MCHTCGSTPPVRGNRRLINADTAIIIGACLILLYVCVYIVHV